MLARHHLSQLIPNRVNAAVTRLQAGIWSEELPLEVEATAAGPDQCGPVEARRLPREPARHGTFWGKLFDQRWCRVLVPRRGANRWLFWEDQGEATMFVRGEPYFGFDVAHRYCRLPSGVREVWIESNCVQSAIWHPEAKGLQAEGSYFRGAFLKSRNDEAWAACHDLECLLQLAVAQRNWESPGAGGGLLPFGLIPPVERASPEYRRLLHHLDEAVDLLETRGIRAMRKRLKTAFSELRSDKNLMRCVLTGHAHIDLVWIWPERIGELKAVHTFATALRLMEEYPEFRFAYSQPASYEAVRRRAPGLYARVRKSIDSGRWEATGAMYVESDTMLPCGEALARSFLLGQQGFEEICGRRARLTWLPDVFGYSACLPQIMKLTGVEYFFTTKMTWNAVNRFPYSSFVWRGNDGSDVVAHVSQDIGYVTHMNVADVRKGMLAHQQGGIHPEFLLPTGYGDGGGGPTAGMCERAKRLGSLPGMPEIEWGQPEAFFERLAELRDRLPVHQGECYLEYHRGTFTTHGEIKAVFRALERTLHTAEAVACITGKRWDIRSAWKRLVFAQFHDYIPGSSVWDVYLEGKMELSGLAETQKSHSLAALTTRKTGAPCVFNPHAVPVKTWIARDAPSARSYVELPPLSGTPVDSAKVLSRPEMVSIKKRTVSNGIVAFRVSARGWIDQLEFDGRAVPLHSPAGQLMVFPDRAANFESWDIDRHVLSLGKPCDAVATIEPIDDAGIRAGFRIRRPVGKASSAAVSFTLEAGSPLLHIEIDLDWLEEETLLKMRFPTRFAATHARFGAPFGSVLRPQVASGMVAEAMWEVPFSRYLAVFDEGERDGIFLVTEAKYGASVRDGEAAVSLVRSPRVTGFEGHSSAWPPHLSRLGIPSRFSDIGAHRIRLAVGRYAADLPRVAQPAAVAETLFSEPLSYNGGDIESPIQSICGGESLVPVWAMPAPDGSWVLRFHEVGGSRGTTVLQANGPWKMAASDFAGASSGDPSPEIAIDFDPYQIVSVEFSK